MAGNTGYYSGVDFERRVYEYYGGSSTFTTGTDGRPAIGVRDDSIDTTQVEEALNDSLLEIYQRVLERGANNGGPNRLTHVHDFTYPASAEFVPLRTTGLPIGSPQMAPPLPSPWFDLVALYDRSTDTVPEKPLTHIPLAQFWEMSGRRWSFSHDALYYCDRWREHGPSEATEMRLLWVPRPEPIDIAGTVPREDIPLELHRPIALNSALRLLRIARHEDGAPVAAQLAEDLTLALRSLSKSVRQPVYVTDTRGRRSWR